LLYCQELAANTHPRSAPSIVLLSENSGEKTHDFERYIGFHIYS
jgi:hypothetical protein